MPYHLALGGRATLRGMKPTVLLLSLGLTLGLLCTAQAQTVPAAPVPVPAVPASTLPASTLPASTVPVSTPASPLPDLPAPPDARPPLLLGAPVGASAEYVSSNTSTISINQFRFAAQSGKTVSAAELAKLNARLESQKQQMAELFSKSANAVSSKVFVRVMPNDAAGNRVLATTTITNVTLPAPQPAARSRSRRAAAPKPMTQTVTTTVTQTVTPGGKLLKVGITTSDAKLQKVYDGLDTQGLLRTQGLDGVSLYGLPLALNKPVSQNYTLDVQNVFGNVLGSLGAGDTLKAQPLNMQVSSSLVAETPLRQYTQNYSAQPWAMTVQVGEGKSSAQMRLTTDNLSGQRKLTYRADGLLQQASTDELLRLGMTTEVPGTPYQMEMVLDIATKTTVLPK